MNVPTFFRKNCKNLLPYTFLHCEVLHEDVEEKPTMFYEMCVWQ